MVRSLAACGALMCALSVGLPACDKGDEVPPATQSDPGAGLIRIAVESGRSERGQLELETRSVGIVSAWQSAGLRAETGGRVQRVHVDNGDLVEAGALLVQIDTSRQGIAVSAAKVQVEGIKEDLAFAEREAERKRQLVERGSAASITLDAAQHSVTMAKSGLAAAQTNLRSARRQAKDGRVSAPFAGVVTARMVDAGDTTAPGAPLLEVVDLSRLRVRIGVAGSELAGIELGSEAEVRVEDLGGLELPAKVASIAPAAHPVTGLFDVELHAPNPQQRVRGGMVASVQLDSAVRTPKVLVSRDAVTRRGGHTIVFEIVDGVARERKVIAGSSDGQRVEIISGLPEGALVATSALHTLAEGVEVEALQGDAPSVASGESVRPATGSPSKQ